MVDEVLNQHIQYHLDCVTNKKVFVVTLMDLIVGYSYYQSNPDIELDLTYINSCPDDCDFILIDYATNYSRGGVEESIFKQLSHCSLPKPWIIITSDFKYFNQPHSHIVYYPIYLIDGLDKGGNTEIEIKNHRSHNICFLTYHYHWHRVLILLALYKDMNFESCLINLPEQHTLTASQSQSLHHSFVYLSKLEQQTVDNMFKMAPIVADSTDLQIEIVELNNKAFGDSYINIFTESDYPKPFVTEKSVKPFLSGQFFAVFNNPAAYQHLKDLGFDLFEDYLPMPQYDNFRQNIKELMESINNLIHKIDTVWDATYERRLHNYQLSRSAELRDRLCYELSRRLNTV
jgi:hypothetical protein